MNTSRTDYLFTGLTQEEIAALQKKYGPNILTSPKPDFIGIVFLQQFLNPLIYLLVAAAIFIFVLGYHTDAFIISGVLLFNAILGTIQEGRTRSILKSLQSFISQQAAVIRDSAVDIIDCSQLVPGDMLLLQAGEKVPADARVIEADNLQLDEAMLTGESKPITKTPHPNHNLIWSGTYIVSGNGKAIVTAIGNNTHLGKLHVALETIQTDTPLKQSIDQLAHRILIAIIIICSILFTVGVLTGKPIKELVVMITALFICIIPEGLPVVVTLTLVSGAYRMAKKNVVTKNMQAIEGLGRTNILIVDKTGTLTRNEMVITTLYTHTTQYAVTGQGYHPEGSIIQGTSIIQPNQFPPDLLLLIQIAGLLSTAQIEYQPESDTFHIKGDPTEAALHVLAQKFSIHNNKTPTFKKIAHMPFSTLLRYQAGIYEQQNNNMICVTGGPEMILLLCSQVSQEDRDMIDLLLKKGLRIVVAAYRLLKAAEFNPATIQAQDIPPLLHDLIFLGIYGVQDTIRSEVLSTVNQARAAGINIIMATGDHENTALYVAKEVGIFKTGDSVINGSQLISHPLTPQNMHNVTVYCRVTPEQKLHIVQAYRQQGNIVAMTGDGVNDAPSLKAADLGIAMGGIGTEVTKQAADLILLDDSLESIIEAIKEGRTIFQAIRRIILYFFTTNLAEVWLIVFSFLLQLPLPILAAQILWINLITDGFLDAALSQEPQEQDILNPHHSQATSLLDSSSWVKILLQSITMGMIAISIFAWYIPYGIALARTLAMTTLATCQWFNAWNCRSEYYSIFTLSPFSNRWLVAATILVLILQVSIVSVEPLQKVFGTVPLTIQQWFLVVIACMPIILLEEIRKFFTVR